MSFQQKFMVSLETKEGRLNFFGTIHRTSKPEDLKMDPEKFYKKFGGKIPDGIHHEIEWEGLPKLCENTQKDLIHIHEENEKNFVCWTKQVSTEEESYEIAKMASLGILYGSKTGKDFGEIFADCKKSVGETIQRLYELCELKYEIALHFDDNTINAMQRHNLITGKIFFL